MEFEFIKFCYLIWHEIISTKINDSCGSELDALPVYILKVMLQNNQTEISEPPTHGGETRPDRIVSHNGLGYNLSLEDTRLGNEMQKWSGTAHTRSGEWGDKYGNPT